MKTRIALFTDCDDAFVFWGIGEAIPGCSGFAIEREQRMPDGTTQRITLENRTDFNKHPQPEEHRPSTSWPFQRFSWTDHSVNAGGRVRYRVTPMVHAAGTLYEDISARSDWTPWVTLSPKAADKTRLPESRRHWAESGDGQSA